MREYETLKAKTVEHRFDSWYRILRDLERNAEPEHSMVYFPNSSSYVFSTGAAFFWMMDPYYCCRQCPPDELEKIAELMREKLSLVLITHLHGDHCQADLIKKLADAPIQWIIPEWLKNDFIDLTSLPEEKVLGLPETVPFLFNGLSITAFPGYHAEPGKTTVPSGAYYIKLPDGVTMFFPADVRDYHKPIPSAVQQPDFTFAHVFLGRESCEGNTFSKLEDFCRFMTSRNTKQIFLTHLCEVERDAKNTWMPRHARIAATRMKELEPQLVTWIPEHGEGYHLVSDPKRYADVFAEWTSEDRKEFLSQLGVSIKADHAAWMEQAIRDKIPVVEWTYGEFDDIPEKDLLEQLYRWRECGGKCLSLHMPNVSVDQLESFRKYAQIAVKIKTDRVTIHEPVISVDQMTVDREKILKIYEREFAILIKNGIRIGIENLHMKPNVKTDGTRGYGYFPEEFVSFVMDLRKRMNTDLIGCHVDIGHAYSNMPFSRIYETASWLNACGTLINGLHIHQFELPVTEKNPHLKGHAHVSGRTLGHPSLLPLYHAWSKKIFRAPMILEVKYSENGPFLSLERLRKIREDQ